MDDRKPVNVDSTFRAFDSKRLREARTVAMEYGDYVSLNWHSDTDICNALNSEVSAAIAKSIGEDRVVAIEACDYVGYGLLYDGMTLEADDSVDFKGVVEFWGVTDEGKQWRVDLLKIGE